MGNKTELVVAKNKFLPDWSVHSHPPEPTLLIVACVIIVNAIVTGSQ
jgi:hypothetical protein